MTTERPELESLIQHARACEHAGAWDEALEGYEAAFGQLGTQGDASTAAELMRRIGRVHRERGDVELAVEAFETSLEIARANGLRSQIAQALNSLGTAEQFRGRLDAAEPLYEQARALALETGDGRLAAMAQQNLGIVSNIRGDLPGALGRYRSALDLHRDLGDDLPAARTLNNMGMAHVDLSEWDAAERCFAEAQQLAEAVGDVHIQGKVQLNRAELHLKRQQYEQARECCDRSIEIFRRVKSKLFVAEAYKFYGVLYRDTSKPELADVHFGLALGLAEASQDPLLEAEAQSEWALADLEAGRHRQALQRFNRAHRLFQYLRARRDLNHIERRLQDLKKAYLPAAMSWGAETIEGRDPLRKGHVERVGGYSAALADAVGVEGWDLAWVRVGAYVHDIGTTAVPEEVLKKPGRLTPEERELMQSHTVVGDAIVAEMGFPTEIRHIVRSHHEHWDGRGYPDRLRGQQIPIFARILTVADVYDALTTPRRYRPALRPEEALQTMKAEAGRVLDPDLFDTFQALAREGALQAVAA